MKTFCNTCGQQLRIHDKEPRGKVKPIPSSPSSVDVEPDTEHGMSSEELAGRFGAHFKPAVPEAGVEVERLTEYDKNLLRKIHGKTYGNEVIEHWEAQQASRASRRDGEGK